MHPLCHCSFETSERWEELKHCTHDHMCNTQPLSYAVKLSRFLFVRVKSCKSKEININDERKKGCIDHAIAFPPSFSSSTEQLDKEIILLSFTCVDFVSPTAMCRPHITDRSTCLFEM